MPWLGQRYQWSGVMSTSRIEATIVVGPGLARELAAGACDERVVAAVEPDLELAGMGGGRGREQVEVGGVDDRRLLAEDAVAGGEGAGREEGVGVVGGGDDHDAALGEAVDGGGGVRRGALEPELGGGEGGDLRFAVGEDGAAEVRAAEGRGDLDADVVAGAEDGERWARGGGSVAVEDDLGGSGAGVGGGREDRLGAAGRGAGGGEAAVEERGELGGRLHRRVEVALAEQLGDGGGLGGDRRGEAAQRLRVEAVGGGAGERGGDEHPGGARGGAGSEGDDAGALGVEPLPRGGAAEDGDEVVVAAVGGLGALGAGLAEGGGRVRR